MATKLAFADFSRVLFLRIFRSFFLDYWINAKSPNLGFLLVGRYFAIFQLFVAFFKFFKAVLLPLLNFQLQFFVGDKFGLLEGTSGEGVPLVVQEVPLDVDPVDELPPGKSDWLSHELSEGKGTV